MPLLEAGTVIGAAEIAAIATAQCMQLSVYRRPRVAILSTGDELITPDRTLEPGQIVDSNQYALTSFVVAHGGLPICLGIVPDNPEALTTRITASDRYRRYCLVYRRRFCRGLRLCHFNLGEVGRHNSL